MKYVLGWGAIILFFGGLVIGGFFLVKNVNTDVFSYKDVEELTYGDYDITNLVKQKIECKKDECTFKKKKVDYALSEVKQLGKQKLDLEIEYDKEKYKHTFEVNIVDKKAPEITLSDKYAVLNVNSKWDSKSYITDVKDNFDELSIDDIEIEDNVNPKKIGDYEVIYKIKDSSGNEGKSILKVMIKDPKTKVELPKEETPSTPTISENEKFEAKISTTGIYDFHNTLNQDNKTDSVSKDIMVGWDSKINFNIDLKGSGAYTFSYNIANYDTTANVINNINNKNKVYAKDSKDTIDTNHKFSYEFDEEGTYYIYIKLKDRFNNVTLEQKIKIVLKVPDELQDVKFTHSEKNGKEYIYLYTLGGNNPELDDIDFDTDDDRYYDVDNIPNLIKDYGDYMTLDFKTGCYYKLMVVIKDGNKKIERTLTIQK